MSRDFNCQSKSSVWSCKNREFDKTINHRILYVMCILLILSSFFYNRLLGNELFGGLIRRHKNAIASLYFGQTILVYAFHAVGVLITLHFPSKSMDCIETKGVSHLTDSF